MKKSPLLVIFAVVFFDLVGFGIVIPILPYYSKTFGASALGLGLLMASYSITQFLFAPFWGALSDRYGRRPVLLSTIFASAIAMAATATAPNLFWLFVARSLAGAFGANISTANAYIADITSPENRAKGMGVIGAGFGLGFIFGPAIGGILSPYGYSVPIYFAASLALLNFAWAFFVLEEPPGNASLRQKNRRKLSLSAFKDSLSRFPTAFPTLLFFVSTFAFTQLEVSFGLFVLERYGLSAKAAGILLAGMGIVGALVQGGLIGKLSKRFGEIKLLQTGFALMSLALLIAGLPLPLFAFGLALSFVSLGNSLVNPSLSSLVSKAAPEERRGEILGTYQSAASLARVVGPPVSGFLFDRAGIASPIFLSCGLMAAIFLCVILQSKRWSQSL